MDASTPTDSIMFGRFRLDPLRGLVRCDDPGGVVPVNLGSRALAVLKVLIERHGDLVSKDELMAAVWPDTAVEEANLTVQISTLRRILDDASETGSCINTISGRGYRFVLPVSRVDMSWVDNPSPSFGDAAGARSRISAWHWRAAGTGAVAIIAAVIAFMWIGGWPARVAPPPRLSLVVLPFENLSGDPKDDYLADGITDDLTSDLSDIPGARVTARESAYTFKGAPRDVRKIGERLGVRYVLEGSVRRIEDTLRVNVQLTSAETGMHLWSDRFNERVADLNAGQEQVVMRMRDELSISLVQIEAVRSLRERPINPDAFDLILRVRSIRNLPPSPERDKQALALLERALELDPNSVYAMTSIAYFLTASVGDEGWGDFKRLQRAERLLARARALAPGSEGVLNTYVFWLRTVGRCPEAIAAAEHALGTDPNGTRVLNRDLQRACNVQSDYRARRGRPGAAKESGPTQPVQSMEICPLQSDGLKLAVAGP